jgi:hypothetical protein
MHGQDVAAVPSRPPPFVVTDGFFFSPSLLKFDGIYRKFLVPFDARTSTVHRDNPSSASVSFLPPRGTLWW